MYADCTKICLYNPSGFPLNVNWWKKKSNCHGFCGCTQTVLINYANCAVIKG